MVSSLMIKSPSYYARHFTYLALVGEILRGSRIALGAQKMYPEAKVAYTSEVSPTILAANS
jgi:triosephosphate isomerase